VTVRIPVNAHTFGIRIFSIVKWETGYDVKELEWMLYISQVGYPLMNSI
jgi:hypothetical protein